MKNQIIVYILFLIVFGCKDKNSKSLSHSSNNVDSDIEPAPITEKLYYNFDDNLITHMNFTALQWELFGADLQKLSSMYSFRKYKNAVIKKFGTMSYLGYERGTKMGYEELLANLPPHYPRMKEYLRTLYKLWFDLKSGIKKSKTFVQFSDHCIKMDEKRVELFKTIYSYAEIDISRIGGQYYGTTKPY